MMFSFSEQPEPSILALQNRLHLIDSILIFEVFNSGKLLPNKNIIKNLEVNIKYS